MPRIALVACLALAVLLLPITGCAGADFGTDQGIKFRLGLRGSGVALTATGPHGYGLGLALSAFPVFPESPDAPAICRWCGHSTPGHYAWCDPTQRRGILAR